MPLDTSIYSLSGLRIDGRRWNELRRIHGQLSTQQASDGSSYFEMGNTKVICTITGPRESGQRGRGRGGDQSNEATVECEINVAGFSGVDRKRRGRGDKRLQELSYTLSSAFSTTLLTTLYPHSTITLTLHILSQDGALLAAALNASTLALIDAGIPMTSYIAACTVGSTVSASDDNEADPVLDLNGIEEAELPFLTLGTVMGGGAEEGEAEDKVSVLVMETRVQMARLEAMISVGLDGCRQVRGIMDAVVREHGRKVLEGRLG